MVRIGTAGWSVPRDVAGAFGSGPSAIARYATVFDAVEINSSFYRPHRPATYARWAAAVPADFRFAVKLPKAITHDAGLVGAEAVVDRFLQETFSLGPKRGPILVQTPPKLAFDARAVAALAARLTAGGAAAIAWEPRHASWFEPDVDAWLADHRIARVAADPARHPEAGEPGGWRGLTYRRLHGSPRMYYSGYDAAALLALAEATKADRASAKWIVFDNTASGEAARNALSLGSLVSRAVSAP
jgi:uncharacterized protein YecE (DUF72 family)